MKYRTFEDTWGFVWRYDGVNLEIGPADNPSGWVLSMCTIEDLLKDTKITETTPKPMNTIYRTFKDTLPGMEGKWRWDSKKMEVFCGGEWFPSDFTSPEEILAEETITETTPKQES